MRRDEAWVAGGASIFLILGGALFGIGVRNLWRAVDSPGWPTTPGIVAASDTSQDVTTDRRTRASSTIYTAKILVKYKVNGRDYSTDSLHFGQIVGSGDSSDAELRRSRYPAGNEVTVSYQPRDPSIATVEPGFNTDALWLPGAGLGFLVPAVMFIALYLGLARDNRMLGVGLGMFAGIFATLGLMLLAGGVVNLWRAHASQKWPQTEGVITYGAIDESHTIVEERDGDLFRASTSGARVIYRYEVGGRKHYSNVRVFGQLAGASGDWAASISARYPLGKVVSVAYSPDNPDLAVLETGIDSEGYWLPGAGAAFLLFGLAVAIWGIPALTRNF